MKISAEKVRQLDRAYLSQAQVEAVAQLANREYTYKWQLEAALSTLTDEWKKKEATRLNKLYNKNLQQKLAYVESTFHVDASVKSTRRLH